jgi:cytoplasmic polyadenylation element-binding protein
MLNAVALAHINDLFVGVVYAGIDTDRHNYPIGSGSVTFSNANSYQMVVTVAFIEIETLKVTKKVQVLQQLPSEARPLLLQVWLLFIINFYSTIFIPRYFTCFKYYCRY